MPRPRQSLNALWRRIGEQLHHPSGLPGRIVGRLMGLANAKPNALAIAALDLHYGESVIELGCGPGHALQALLRLPRLKQAIGLDWSETMLAQAARRNRLALKVDRLKLARGDLARLPFADESADAVLAVNVIYFMSESSVSEARRVLRPGGRLVIYATHASAMRRWPFASGHSHKLFDGKRLSGLLAEGGFAQDRIRIKDVDAGFGINGLLAVAIKQDANAVIWAETKWMTRSVPTAGRAAVVRSQEAPGTPIEINISPV